MKIYKIGGRSWRVIEVSTLGHDLFVTQQLLEGKLDGLRLGSDEKLHDFAMRMLGAIMASGKAFLLLGSMLLPEDVPDQKWTPALAEESAAFFDGLTDADDKAAAQQALAPLLVGFFVAGMDSAGPSGAASSVRPQAGTPSATAPRKNISATSGNGIRSSVPWWARIFGARKKHAAGSSANA